MTPDASGTAPRPVDAEIRVEGAAASPGIAIGQVYLFSAPRLHVESREILATEAPEEMTRFERACERSVRELRKVATFAREKLGEASAEIFEAQIMVLEDSSMHASVRNLITRDHHSADYAVATAVGAIRRRMESSPSEYLRERASDISTFRTACCAICSRPAPSRESRLVG
jgi:phosphoenolpyruvate-protein phosphotransferase (PTS system enzyme I)